MSSDIPTRFARTRPAPARRRRRIILAAALLFGSFVLPLRAHDTWILPEQGRARIDQAVSFDLTSGMAFPANEVAIKPDRLARAARRLAGEVADLKERSAEDKALRLRARFEKAGIAAVWIESKPRSLELKPAEVREYLEEIGAWESVGRNWESAGKGRWRETYTKHAKAFVRVGRPDRDESWKEPVGMEFEIVPERDPTRIAVGDELPVRLLKGGQPLTDLAVGLVAANAKSGSLSKTDPEGRVRLRFERGGWWLIRSTVLEPSSKPDMDWDSHFTTLTVFVGAK